MGTTRQKSSCRNRLQNGPHSLLRMKVGTHSPLPTGSHTAAHRAKRGAFRMGGGISTLGAFHTFRKPCVARYQNGKLCRFWGLVGCAPEERGEPAEQRCAHACRCSAGVAAPPGCAIFSVSVEIAACMPCSGLSACARQGWYHYPQRALRAAETPDGRLSKRLICRFLRSGGRSSPHDSYFLANTQNFLLAVPVANAFALWYDKFSKLEVVIVTA